MGNGMYGGAEDGSDNAREGGGEVKFQVPRCGRSGLLKKDPGANWYKRAKQAASPACVVGIILRSATWYLRSRVVHGPPF
jgi:hypothetical protein